MSEKNIILQRFSLLLSLTWLIYSCPSAQADTGAYANMQHISGGNRYTCALTLTGGVKCWGSNYTGQLGDDTGDDQYSAVDVSGLTAGVSAIAVGREHACALLNDVQGSHVKCWGSNLAGALGVAMNEVASLAPVDVLGLPSNIIALTAGHNDTCALTGNNTIYCWGNNTQGQLGDGSTVNRFAPAMVSGITDAVAIAAGAYHVCARLISGELKCWGSNSNSQLGIDPATLAPNSYSAVPITVQAVTNVVDIAAGAYHTCARIADSLSCWGSNSNGQLGDSTTASRYTPAIIPNLTQVTAVSLGERHTCAIISEDQTMCWGFNSSGNIGDGTFTQRPTPVFVLNTVGAADTLGGVTWIGAGWNHTCAIVIGNEAVCWGLNSDGQLNLGAVTSAISRPLNEHIFGSGFD